jgi:ATP-dependent exoDNAse (exonuclease V) beta subunit
MLSTINSHPRDKNISKNKYHQYLVNGKKLNSVTKLVSSFFKPFDEDKIINSILNSKKMEDPDYKYYQKTREQIKDMWKDSTNLGTELHLMVEDYLNGVDKIFHLSTEFQYFLNFMEDYSQLPYRTEWMIYDEEIKVGGCIDAIFKKDGKYIMYDWKRCNNLTFESNDKSIKECISYLPDTNYWHYVLQLNIYTFIIHKNYGIKIDSMNLVVLHPENSNYQIYEVPFMELINLF